MAALTVGARGVVFRDIGTSPLFARWTRSSPAMDTAFAARLRRALTPTGTLVIVGGKTRPGEPAASAASYGPSPFHRSWVSGSP